MSRIADLPVRDWRADAEATAEAITRLFRTEVGTQKLRPIQGVSLLEMAQCFGLFASIRVGGGKTLISALAPVALCAERPLLLVPAALKKKTDRDFAELRLHWKIPNIRIESYTKLSVESGAELLDAYQPDLIIADEAQKLKNLGKSAVSRRIERYLTSPPRLKGCGRDAAFVALSGTPTKESLKDYWHLLRWALRDQAPVPVFSIDAEAWADCLDARQDTRFDLKVLVPHLGENAEKSQDDARKAYKHRLASTPGVVITNETFDAVPLTISPIKSDTPPGLEEHFQNLRDLWTAPDGYELADARFEVWGLARQLALGFFYRLDPRPPEAWASARRCWAKFARETIEQDDSSYDSAGQVATACDARKLPSWALDAWREVEPTFKPNRIPTWLDSSALEDAAAWAELSPGLVWVDHIEFGRKLAEITGFPYYHENGQDELGRPIETDPAKRSAIVSVASNHAGRNLQNWSRNLIVSPDGSGVTFEQLIGRTHRDGQTKQVSVEYFARCFENLTSVEKAWRESNYMLKTTGQKQKMILGNFQFPGFGKGRAWR